MNDRDGKIITNLFTLAQDIEPVNSSRISACIVLKNNLISYGFNQRKTHPFQAQYAKNDDSIFLHAETDAIKNALKRISTDELSRCTLYIARAKHISNRSAAWIRGLACPCEGCMRAIVQFNIKKVVYTVDGPDYKYL